MAKKAKQRVRQKLTFFQRIWNSSDATPEQKQAAADHFGDGPGPANGQSSSSERRPRKMKGLGLLIILLIALVALLIWHRVTLKKSQPVLAQTTETTVTDTVKIIEEEKPQAQQPKQSQPKAKDEEVKKEVFETPTSTPSVESPQPEKKAEPEPVKDDKDKATTAPTKPVFPTSGRKEDLDQYMIDYKEWLIYQKRQERPDLYCD